MRAEGGISIRRRPQNKMEEYPNKVFVNRSTLCIELPCDQVFQHGLELAPGGQECLLAAAACVIDLEVSLR